MSTITSPIAHLCHARSCPVPVPPRMLMCKAHWFALPHHVRRNIWRLYRPGQEIDKRPSKEYLDAMNAAIDWLANKENAE